MIVGANVLGYSRGGCVLDALSAGVPAAAYSLRRLTASYKGKCINVRRSSDNSAMDIGFVGNQLDKVTLLAFCGSGSGYVTKWYNQGSLGSSCDLPQANASGQPRIVNAGALEASNGQPSLNFMGSAYFSIPAAVCPSGAGNSTANFVLDLNGTHNPSILVWGQYSGGRVIYLAGSGPYNIEYYNGQSTGQFYNNIGGVSSSGAQIVTVINAAPTMYGYVNGVANSPGTLTPNTTASNSALGTGNGANWGGKMSEVILNLSALSTADRQTLEHNQESYYGISGS